ncbi:MAG TPA: bifunctional 3-deoxy-7-phosphoheptulonate synthase/chorismate mutase type II [Cyclobacteriaceae bacterium]|nr:bifunctional 3-deoxy-7-phosphoheptulonate synthase/chorismate mutase type II [Cyclobacteriaceae bacterium]HRJ83910.1 bifunctional 3-deoxy-7-phosphoheptulonate synthase/chorismate mutase type II [Cyclobacteriaceae bacterium]
MKLTNWISAYKTPQQPLLIAGPCSAESPEQLMEVAQAVKSMGISVMRAGVWKPRTRPNSFEGKGKEALAWIKEVKQKTGLAFAIEVANPAHVELACEAGVEILWVGARTTVNPFTVQEIADALQGIDKIVLVKNPINPELSLWIGALERLNRAGIQKLGAIHRGFSSFQKSRFRNQPLWQIALELKTLHPELPLIADPSHIAGNRNMIFEVSQKALDLDYDGLMIETHPDPDRALSDAQQQITPTVLATILKDLRVSERASSNALFINQLEALREKIDHLDQELIELLSTRAKLTEQIGEYKKENNVTVFQLERWNEIMNTRPEWAKLAHVSPDFVRELYKIIHDESIRIQTEIMNKTSEPER